eukprot:4093458-Prymnesium_polylepis.1
MRPTGYEQDPPWCVPPSGVLGRASRLAHGARSSSSSSVTPYLRVREMSGQPPRFPPQGARPGMMHPGYPPAPGTM